MELRHLEQILEICRAGGFSGAARKLQISQPTLSKSIARLEAQLSLKLFVDTLTRFDVQPIDPVGQPFDPQFHQAMSMVENPSMEPNSVMAVLQKGYSLHGRLVRPAMVVVSRAAAPRVDERA